MLEVVIKAHQTLGFRWEVLDSGEFVAGGQASTRAAAKLEGDSAMFRVWSARTFGSDQPW
jgi:hypothetical protein